MITVKDCEAFCDADSDWVHELACRECLAMVPAYASAHEAMVCANNVARQAPRAQAVGPASDHRSTN